MPWATGGGAHISIIRAFNKQDWASSYKATPKRFLYASFSPKAVLVTNKSGEG